MKELIDRQAAIDALGERPHLWTGCDYELGCVNQYDLDKLAIETVPPAQGSHSDFADLRAEQEERNIISPVLHPAKET